MLTFLLLFYFHISFKEKKISIVWSCMSLFFKWIHISMFFTTIHQPSAWICGSVLHAKWLFSPPSSTFSNHTSCETKQCRHPVPVASASLCFWMINQHVMNACMYILQAPWAARFLPACKVQPVPFHSCSWHGPRHTLHNILSFRYNPKLIHSVWKGHWDSGVFASPPCRSARWLRHKGASAHPCCLDCLLGRQGGWRWGEGGGFLPKRDPASSTCQGLHYAGQRWLYRSTDRRWICQIQRSHSN